MRSRLENLLENLYIKKPPLAPGSLSREGIRYFLEKDNGWNQGNLLPAYSVPDTPDQSRSSGPIDIGAYERN
jgi:hypothetical protein